MLHPVVIIDERLTRVEWRVDVDEFHSAAVLAAKLRHLSQDAQHIETVASEEKIVTLGVVLVHLADGRIEVVDPDLRGRRMVPLHPDRLPVSVLGDEKKLILVGPGQLKAC